MCQRTTSFQATQAGRHGYSVLPGGFLDPKNPVRIVHFCITMDPIVRAHVSHNLSGSPLFHRLILDDEDVLSSSSP